MAEPEPDADDDRTIFDICMELADAAEEDAAASAESPNADSRAVLLALLREVGALLRGTADEEDREMFVGEDGLQLTLAALKRHTADAEFVRVGWSAVQHVCVHQPPHRRMVADEGGLELLGCCWAAHEADSEVICALLSCVSQLCMKDERNKVMLNGLGVSASIMAALEAFGEEDGVASALLDTLCAMMRDDDAKAEQKFRGEMIGALWEHADVLNVLIELVEAERAAPVLHSALRALLLVCNSTKWAEEAVDNGLVDLALGLLSSPARLSEPLVLASSLQLLKSLSQHNEAAKESLLGDSADELLLGLLKSQAAHPKVLEAATDLLLAIMFRDEATSAKLVASGLIPVILAGLAAHPAAKSLFRSSCMMLRELCRVEDNQRIMKEEGVEKLMLAGMERFGDATDGVGMGERGYKGGIPFQEYARDVLRDCFSDRYRLGTHSMGVSLLDLDKRIL